MVDTLKFLAQRMRGITYKTDGRQLIVPAYDSFSNMTKLAVKEIADALNMKLVTGKEKEPKKESTIEEKAVEEAIDDAVEATESEIVASGPDKVEIKKKPARKSKKTKKSE